MKKYPRVIIATLTYRPILGGIVEYCYQLTRALVRLGAEVTVVAPACEGSRAYDAGSPQVKIVRTWPPLPASETGPLVKGLKLGALSGLAAGARRLAKHSAADLVYLPTSYPLAIAFRDLAAKKVITFHGREVLAYTEASGSARLHARVLKESCGCADLVFCNSTFTAGLLQRLDVNARKVFVTGCGADWERFCTLPRREDVRARLGLEDRRVLLTVGKLVARKGVDTVLQALPRVCERFPDTYYVVVGYGPRLESLQAMAEGLGLGARVRFTGPLTDREVRDYMVASDVFVMPNRQTADGSVEGFGIVFLEANACLRPVIGGCSGGVADAIVPGVTGMLVDPYDAGEVAVAIEQLLADPAEAERMGLAGRMRVERDYTWRAVATRTARRMLSLVCV